MSRFCLIIVALIATAASLSACCARPPAGHPDYNYDLPGPTTMAKVPGGYQLCNRHIRLILDGKTGDVVYWGPADDTIPHPWTDHRLQAGLKDQATAIPDGYIEPRDAQTWQYLGEDATADVGWRKIYCLDGDNLDVTYLIQNHRKAPLMTQIGLIDNSSGQAVGRFHTHVQAFNESNNLPLPAGVFAVSDPHTLKPQERISWTMRWTLDAR